MSEPENAILPILKAIQVDIAELKEARTDIAVLKEAVQRIDARISSMDSFMAGFHSTLNWQGGDLDELCSHETLTDRLRRNWWTNAWQAKVKALRPSGGQRSHFTALKGSQVQGKLPNSEIRQAKTTAQ